MAKMVENKLNVLNYYNIFTHTVMHVFRREAFWFARMLIKATGFFYNNSSTPPPPHHKLSLIIFLPYAHLFTCILFVAEFPHITYNHLTNMYMYRSINVQYKVDIASS